MKNNNEQKRDFPRASMQRHDVREKKDTPKKEMDNREKLGNSLGCLVIIIIAVFAFKVVLFMSHNEGYRQGQGEILPADASQSDHIPDDGEMVLTSTPELEQAYSSNSIYNWQYAVDIWNDCKNVVSFYQDWVNWYGEESAMRMCLITKAENGTREAHRIGYNNNGSRDVGAFQINTIHCGKVGEQKHSDSCVAKLQNENTNIAVARQIYEAQGWSPWVAKKAYLPDFWADRLTIN
jgi:hypothetical protein